MTDELRCEHALTMARTGSCRFCGASAERVRREAIERHERFTPTAPPSPYYPLSLPRTSPMITLPMPTRKLPMHAAPVFTFRGRQIARVKGFVRPHELKCPDLHRVKEDAIMLEDGALFCKHRAAAGQGECGAMLYVLVFPSRGGRRRFWAADVTKAELEEMERMGLDADGALAYFGAGFTR